MPDDEDQQSILPNHPLSPKFDTDATPADVETVVGFVGDSPIESRVRVYTDLLFASYYEFDRSDVANASPVDSREADGPIVVQVRASARIEFVRVARLAGEASYVAGSIRAAYGGDDGGQDDGGKAFHSPPYPVTPVLYCLSRVYPPCPEPTVTKENICFTRGFATARSYAC